MSAKMPLPTFVRVGLMYSHERSDHVRDSSSMDWVRSTLGVLGVFASLGVGLLVLAFAAANGLKNVNFNDPDQANLAATAYLVGVLPLVAAPILAAIGGMWAGTRTRHSGSGALAGALGAVLGVIVLGLLVALGFNMGAQSAGVDISRIAWPTGFYLRPGWRTTLADIGTNAGLLYLITAAIIGGLAGAVTGALTARFAFREWDTRSAAAYHGDRAGERREHMPRI